MAKYVTSITSEIVAAYVSGHQISPDELVGLIRKVHDTLSTLCVPISEAAPANETPTATPAAIRKSITPEVLISFEDGKGYKTLKRHLSKLGLTADAYREKWGLPNDYPMTAARYSATRSALAKHLGFGNARKGPAETIPVQGHVKKRGRPRKGSPVDAQAS